MTIVARTHVHDCRTRTHVLHPTLSFAHVVAVHALFAFIISAVSTCSLFLPNTTTEKRDNNVQRSKLKGMTKIRPPRAVFLVIMLATIPLTRGFRTAALLLQQRSRIRQTSILCMSSASTTDNDSLDEILGQVETLLSDPSHQGTSSVRQRMENH